MKIARKNLERLEEFGITVTIEGTAAGGLFPIIHATKGDNKKGFIVYEQDQESLVKFIIKEMEEYA